MKIGKKLLISNVLTIVISMIMMSLVIGIIVSNYIQSDIETRLIRENTSAQKFFTWKNDLNSDIGQLDEANISHRIGSDSSVRVIAFLIIDDTARLLTPLSWRKEVYEDGELNNILNEELKESYNTIVYDSLYLAYNDQININVNGETYEILIITLMPNYQIKEIISQIIIVLIASIFIIGAISIFFTSFTSRRITKPIEKLKRITEKIAGKNYEKRVEISTGDEFEELGKSINNMADSIKKHDSEQKKFYENISHELKSPLTVISGYAQGIKTNIVEDKDKAVDIIIEESEAIKKQLENIIYLSKLDSVKDIYKFEKSSINDTIIEAVNKVESIIILNEIDVIYEPANDAILNLDKDKFVRALTNILTNCIKYTKDSIWIETKMTDEKYYINIHDNGVGFNKKVLDSPFSRNNKGEKDGTGIGLSIIKKIIDAHKGNIYLSNHEEQGALYIIEILLP